MKKIISIMAICLAIMTLFVSCVGNVDYSSEEIKEFETSNNDEILGEITENNVGNFLPQNADDSVITYKYFGYVYYGEYPQTVAEKDAVKEMSKTTDKTGYYYSTYDNEHYEKVTSALVYGNKYEFSDEKVINENETYYFKVEPIKWKVFGQFDLSTGKIQLYLLSDMILHNMAFCSKYEESYTDGKWYSAEGIFANNWAYSNVRKWLNETFYNTAFTDEEKSTLIPREVSDVTTQYDETNPTDNVYCLTYAQAVTLGDYSMAQVSDYARCRNAFIAVNADWYGNGRWWLSNAGAESYQASYVSNYNNIVDSTGESVGSEFMGVRPAITISVEAGFEILQEEEEE